MEVKKIFLLFMILFSFLHLNAQQRAQFSQYMNNIYVLNPAAGGTEDYTDIKASYRSQWVGMKGAPTTYYLSGHAPIGKMRGKPHIKNKFRSHHSIGGIAYKDVTGPTSRLGLSGSYSYNMQLTQSIRAAVGTFIGFQQYSLDANALHFHDPGDNAALQKITVPDVSLGIWIYSNSVFMGLSSAQVLQNQLNFTPSENGIDRKDVSKLTTHYSLTGGVKIPINTEWILIPSTMIKISTPSSPSIDINAKVRFQDLFWFGASYRNLDSFIGLAGVTIKSHIDISYSYDATISALSKYNSGSHEILIGVRLPWKQDVLCPQNFW